MDPAARLLRMLSLLQSRPTWSSAELAERLQVDRRTIRRDIARLRDLGYPVESQPGTAGYRLGAGARLPPLLLDDDEAVAIGVGLRLAATEAVSGIEASAVAAMAKLDQLLPVRVRDRVRALDASTVHVGSLGHDPVDAETLSALARACRWSERVTFSYRGFGGVTSERRAEPSQIANSGRRWYLVARDLDRDDWRTFRVDRIASLVLTGHRFERQNAPDAATRVVDAMEYRPESIEATIIIDLEPDVAVRRLGSASSIEAVGDGRSRVTARGSSVGELVRYVLALPAPFEVVSPPELRDEVRRFGSRLARRHA